MTKPELYDIALDPEGGKKIRKLHNAINAAIVDSFGAVHVPAEQLASILDCCMIGSLAVMLGLPPCSESNSIAALHIIQAMPHALAAMNAGCEMKGHG